MFFIIFFASHTYTHTKIHTEKSAMHSNTSQTKKKHTLDLTCSSLTSFPFSHLISFDFSSPCDCYVFFSLSLFFLFFFSSGIHLSFFAVDFMGGDAKCVQHKIVLPMYVSYTSIPTSTANTTMKSTKLLTNPYLDVTTTSSNAATCNPIKSINDHNQSTINRNLIRKSIKSCANSEINTNINDHCIGNAKMGERNPSNFQSMSFNPYQNGTISNNEFSDCTTKKIMTNPMMRSLNTTNHEKPNGIVYRNANKFCGIATGTGIGTGTGTGNGYMPRNIRYSDSDDTRSSSIDYNFNYVKFRSPLNAAGKTVQYRDSSTTSTMATECSSFVAPSPLKHFDDDKKSSSFILPKVHNHPNCKCGIQNCCPFAERFSLNPAIQSYAIAGVHDRKCFVPRYPYRRRDLSTTPLNYDRVVSVDKDSPPDYDQINDFLMKRTFSHDRLYTQRRVTTIRNRTRPKSYCSNVNHYPTQL